MPVQDKNLATPLIFNASGNDDASMRLGWNGNTTGLMNLNNVKFKWATNVYRQMRENFWIPEKVDLSQDKTDYFNLTIAEKRAYDGILSYLTFLDSAQVHNLPRIKDKVTAPEISLCLTEQASQEALHNASYQYCIESIVPPDERSIIYDFWRKDEVLRDRCEFIGRQYQEFMDSPTTSRYLNVLIANYLLEGLYFYNGFAFYYSLACRHLMPGSAEIIRYINRDELTHVRIFQKLIELAFQELGSPSWDEIYEMFDLAVQHECRWTNHILQGEVLGLDQASTEAYTKYLANTRLTAIGIPALYKGVKNPYKHLERSADTSSKGEVKANFFESTVTSYNVSSAISGWDF